LYLKKRITILARLQEVFLKKGNNKRLDAFSSKKKRDTLISEEREREKRG